MLQIDIQLRKFVHQLGIQQRIQMQRECLVDDVSAIDLGFTGIDNAGFLVVQQILLAAR